MKLWTGRTDGGTDLRLDELNNSIGFDRRLYREDIEGSLAHAHMLGETGIITAEDASAIREGLSQILADIENGVLDIDPTAEDIHSFVEAELTKRIGDAGKRLHTARSRNDQVATDMRLFTRKQTLLLEHKAMALIGSLLEQAKQHTSTVMPGYTHLQRAQPVTAAHTLCAYAEMLCRDLGRLGDMRRRADRCPLGAGALAGTTYPIDRHMTARSLGFGGICPNAQDAVSDRDYCLELLSALSILMSHLSRFSEELILWCSAEFSFITLPQGFTTGSSIMPQKKNPDICELVRGKTGRVYGGLTTLLTVMKGLPLAYNKDMQEDKEVVFDALDTVSLCLDATTPMVQGITFHKETLRAAAAKGFLNATDCADYLVTKGLPFREAYRITGSLVEQCQTSGHTLESLPLTEYQALSPLFEGDVYQAVDLEQCVLRRSIPGGPAPDSVGSHIRQIEQYLEGWQP